jgi:hypothetical protein
MALKISAKITLFFGTAMPDDNILGLQMAFSKPQFCNSIRREIHLEKYLRAPLKTPNFFLPVF